MNEKKTDARGITSARASENGRKCNWILRTADGVISFGQTLVRFSYLCGDTKWR